MNSYCTLTYSKYTKHVYTVFILAHLQRNSNPFLHFNIFQKFVLHKLTSFKTVSIMTLHRDAFREIIC